MKPSLEKAEQPTSQRLKPYRAYKDSGVQWLGDIPAHWEVRPLKRLAAMNPESLPENADPDLELVYLDIGSVDGLGRIHDPERILFASAPSRARRLVRDGDVIVSTVRTYLRAIAPLRDPEQGTVASTGFAVVRPADDLNPDYAAYALRAPYFVERVVANSKGVSFPAIAESELSTYEVALPPEPEQRAVADFLDRETARIDALVAKKNRLIELLQEERTALITRAVTRGLDPTVPMEDSGVEWLGEIPAHWSATNIKRLFRQRKRQGYQDLPILSVYRDFGVIEKSSRHDNFNRTPEKLGMYQLVNPGDLVINKMKAWQGSLGISTYRGITSGDYVVFSPQHHENGTFLHHFLRNKLLTNVYRTMSNGIRPAQWRLEPEKFQNLVVFVPPKVEEDQIVAFLDHETARIDALVAKIQEAIERLKELRISLISAAVTGRIDVREAVS